MSIRDMAIEHLAADAAELLERLVDLTIERDAYRDSLRAALEALHRLTSERDRLRSRLYAVAARRQPRGGWHESF
jgi:hypothetical protein